LNGALNRRFFKQTRIRDGYQCILTGRYLDDEHAPEGQDVAVGSVIVAHIVMRAVGVFTERSVRKSII